MRVYSYFGPSPRADGPSMMTHLAMKRLPGVESYWYECHGDPAMFGKADLHVAVDWAEDTGPFKEFVEPRPLVYWMSDTHCAPEGKRFRFDKARRADRVFCSIWSDPESLKGEGVVAKWLPYAAEPLIWYPRVDIRETKDIVFVGHHGRYEARAEFLEQMIVAFPNFHIQGGVYFEECAEMMAMGRVVLNHCEADSINQRVVETLMNGQCLLTNETSDLTYLGLKDGEHMLTYRTTEEAKEKCAMALLRPEWRRHMGEQGRAWALGGHSYLHRAYALLDLPVPPEIGSLMERPLRPDQRTLPESLPVRAVKA